MAAYIMNIIISLLSGFVFVIIGIRQYKSETPVVMNTGEKPLKPEQLRDVKAWNQKHGKASIIFGIAIALTCIIFPIVLNHVDAVISTVIFIIIITLEIVGVMVNHGRLERIYKINPPDNL